jgi:two-component system, LytTR family, response regulator
MRVVIVDDEPLARSRLVHLCQEHAGVQVVAQAASGADAIEAIKAHRPDLVLLDVELQDMTGFDVLRSLESRDGPLAIMVTAHPEHAMEAFDSDAVHYLTKPVDGRRLTNAIIRARSRLSLERGGPGAGVNSLRQITGEKAQRLYFIDVETIDYVESEANYVALHVDDERYLARNTMKHLAGVLGPLGFVRIERSLLINLRRVAFAERLDRGAFVFTLRNGRRLVSSSTYRKGIMEEIRRGQFFGQPAAH